MMILLNGFLFVMNFLWLMSLNIRKLLDMNLLNKTKTENDN